MLRRPLRYSCAASSAGTGASSASASSSSTPPNQRVSLKSSRPPISDDQVKSLFTSKQRQKWPSNYRPTVGTSAFLQKDGVTLSSLVELRKEITDEHNADLQKDLAVDMTLWTRCSFEEEMLSGDDRRRRLVKKVLSRDRIPTYSEVVKFAKVPNLSDGRYEKECRDLPGHNDPDDAAANAPISPLQGPNQQVTADQKLKQAKEARRKMLERQQLLKEKKRYPFHSQAHLQQTKVFSILESSGVQSMNDRVVFPDYPSFSNLLHHHYDSCGFLKFVSSRTGDDLLINQELVRELALYLRTRMEYYHGMQSLSRFRNHAATLNTTSTPTILFMFTNGRLPQAIRDSAIPIFAGKDDRNSGAETQIIATNARKRLVRKDQALPILGPEETPTSYGHEFSYEVMPVVKALEKYRPTIVVAEPHCDRDWTAEMRGFETVREVILLGQADSPAMCSFSYPWLSFGCAPSPESYFVYNSLFQRLNVNQDSQFMPMDPPYIQQGYEKLYLDDQISKWMVCSNDVSDAPHQSRCCVFRRDLEKMKKVNK